ILTHETVPAIAKDPEYLSKNDIEVLKVVKSGSVPVDPSTIDWTKPDEVRQIALRQRPGPHNALGHVKFLLPNEYDVYLHDTPSVRLFSRGSRAFSHGCVRVDGPEKLAAYVLRSLRDDDAWDASRIAQAMQSDAERPVKLDEPVVIVRAGKQPCRVGACGGRHVRAARVSARARSGAVRVQSRPRHRPAHADGDRLFEALCVASLVGL